MHAARRARIALAALLAVGLTLIAVESLGGSATLRTFGGTVFGPAERGVRSLTSPIVGFFERGTAAGGSSGRVRALETQLIRLRAQLNSERLSSRKYAQLSSLLRLPGQGQHQITAADVIGIGQGYQQSVTLDIGSRNGVRPQETVLSVSGLVGTVTSVSPWTSTVGLATDPAAAVGVRLAGSGQFGWVSGSATGRAGRDLLVLHVLGSDSGLAPGQRLVTAASINNRPYVAGVPVGVVTRVDSGSGLTRTALVRPFTDFSALDVVGVVATPDRPQRGRRPHGRSGRLGQPGGGG